MEERSGGSATEVSPASRKALSPMDVTPDGSVTEASAPQERKVPRPMDVTPDGSVMEASAPQE